MKDNNNLEKNKINLCTQSIEKGDISSNNENNITTYSIGMKRNVEDNKYNYEVNNIQNIKRIRVDHSDSYEREKKVTKENISNFEPYNSHYNDKNKITYEIKKTDHTNEINKDGNIMINDNKDTNNIILIILKA